MTDLGKKLLLIPFGAVVGLLLCGVLWLSFKAIHPHPPAITREDVHALKRMLDNDRSPRGLYLYDEHTGYRFKPDFRGLRHGARDLVHVTNSLGLLGPRPVDNTPNVTRALFLGDSVTYGDGIAFEQIFVSQMQELAGQSYLLANGACPGWNTRQELAFYNKHVADIAWDAVVIVFCLNDLAEFRWARTVTGRYKMTMTEVDAKAAKQRLSDLRARFRQSAETRPLASHDDATLMAWDESKWPAYFDRVLVPLVQRPKPPVVVWVVPPSRYQLEALSLGAEPHVALEPQRRLERFCQKNGTPFLDASKAFDTTDKASIESSFRADDYLHFSSAGHRRLAQFLWPRLATLIPKKP